jgi:putative membrane protein
VSKFSEQLSFEARLAAILLIVCGIGCGVNAITRWMRNERAMRLGQPLDSSPMLLAVTAVVVIVAVLGFVVVTFG